MKSTYRVIGMTIAALVVLQAAWVAFASFGVISEVDAGRVIDENYEPNLGAILHSIGGTIAIPLLTLALLVVSFFTKVSGAVKWALFVLLAVVLQIAIAFVSFAVPGIGVLHGVGAFVIAGLAAMAANRMRTKAVATATPPADHMVA